MGSMLRAALVALAAAAPLAGGVALAADADVAGPGTGDAAVAPSEGAAVPGPVEAAAPANPDDPWEGFNRKMFWFNDQVDVYVLEPTAKGWNFVMPQPVQRSVSNFFGNLRTPIIFVNDAFQAKPLEAVKQLGRFFVNTTIGAAGFLDVASEIGLPVQDEDFGQTLGVWGVPSGPYLVLPLLGASNIRDTGGLALDYAASITPFYIDFFYTAGARLVDVINTRSRFLAEVQEAKAASLDYYTFVRDAYTQRRRALIEDRDGRDLQKPLEEPPDESLYEFVEP